MARDPWLRLDAEDGVTFSLAGQPGHGGSAYLRRQSARIVDGRMEGGYTDVFELICGQCGDHPYLDYAEVPLAAADPRAVHAGGRPWSV
jgi:hypothetical protein